MNKRSTRWLLGYGISRNVLLGSALLVAAFVLPGRVKAELSTADPLGFFTNLSSRLLQSEAGLSLNRIQVYPTNQYTPAVHRLLQVTANILDATTNRFNTNHPFLPSVFRPLFTNDNDRIFICGYEEENGPGYTNAWRDLNDPAARAMLQRRDYVYGVPVIIGAKQGFPNFNEFAMQTVFQLSRELQIVRPTVNAPQNTWQTNQMFVLGVSNVVGVELWNSYRTNYPRAVDILAVNLMTATLTNNFGLVLTQQTLLSSSLSVAASNWPGFVTPNSGSFVVPIRTNVVVLPDSIYRHASQSFTTNLAAPFETGLGFPIPQWGIALTNRLRVFLVDQETQRLVDFVTLEGLSGAADLSESIRDPDNASGLDGLWSTNHLDPSSTPLGVVNQIGVALGNYGPASLQWRDYGLISSPATLALQVDDFRSFFGLPPLQYTSLVNTSLVMVCPFTPTRKLLLDLDWQANDPLVHPVRTEVQYANLVQRVSLASTLQTLRNLGVLNNRYAPWGGNPWAPSDDPSNFNPGLKDPLVWDSDRWNFPVSEPLSLAMLGRVHRGTPWQTIYLKSAPADSLTWQDWLQDADWQDAQRTQPTRDWEIAGLLAGLLNTNSPHELLSINDPQTNAWLAALDGISVLTNTAASRSKPPQFDSVTVSSNSLQAGIVVAGIFAARATQPGGGYRNLGALLATPGLTMTSPWLDQSGDLQMQRGISDEAYERIPTQLLSRLRADSVGSVVWNHGTRFAQFTGFDGYPYAVESSADLVNWFSFSTNSPTNGVFSIPVSGTGNEFYRSRLLP